MKKNYLKITYQKQPKCKLKIKNEKTCWVKKPYSIRLALKLENETILKCV